MRFVLMVVLALSVTVSGHALGQSRDRGSGDAARHGDPEAKRDKYGSREKYREQIVVVPRPDPAVENFWSDRCVSQRRNGLPHTKDCDNPAYSGGGYRRYGDPYGGYVPYDRYDRYDRYRRGFYVPPRVETYRGRVRATPLFRGGDERRGRW